MCILHGVTIDHVEAMPICDFLKSSRAKPTAWSMARLAARSYPSTTSLECSRCRLAPFLEAAAFFDGVLAVVVINKKGVANVTAPATLGKKRGFIRAFHPLPRHAIDQATHPHGRLRCPQHS